jgi:hypothetical protein
MNTALSLAPPQRRVPVRAGSERHRRREEGWLDGLLVRDDVFMRIRDDHIVSLEHLM